RAKLARMVQRRVEHEPLAYIRNKTEFYGREFYIDHHVLEPRPESETMIDLLLQIPDNTRHLVIDVGTGSGALAITAKLEVPGADAIAIDIDDNCLSITKRNAQSMHAEVTILKSNLLEAIPGVALHGATLLCNLP